MAAKGKVPSCGCSIVCSEVCSNLRWFLNLKMARKGFPMGIPRSGKNFFFVSFGKAFSSEKANEPFRELANYVS